MPDSGVAFLHARMPGVGVGLEKPGAFLSSKSRCAKLLSLLLSACLLLLMYAHISGADAGIEKAGALQALLLFLDLILFVALATFACENFGVRLKKANVLLSLLIFLGLASLVALVAFARARRVCRSCEGKRLHLFLAHAVLVALAACACSRRVCGPREIGALHYWRFISFFSLCACCFGCIFVHAPGACT